MRSCYKNYSWLKNQYQYPDDFRFEKLHIKKFNLLKYALHAVNSGNIVDGK